MLKGIDINQRIEFSSAKDTEDVKTIIVFRPLSSIEMMELVSDADGNTIKLSGRKIFDYLEKGIVEVKNYSTADVKEALGTFPMDFITELCQEMARINKLSGQDAKN